jgi:hypothetical protein
MSIVFRSLSMVSFFDGTDGTVGTHPNFSTYCDASPVSGFQKHTHHIILRETPMALRDY